MGLLEIKCPCRSVEIAVLVERAVSDAAGFGASVRGMPYWVVARLTTS